MSLKHSPAVAPAPTPTPAHLLVGKPLHDALLLQLKEVVAALPTPPSLAIVQVGDLPASEAYVTHKLKACAACGIIGERIYLREDEGEAALHAALRGLAHDNDITGIIVQLPLPDGWDKAAALALIPQAKDVDGLGPENLILRRLGAEHALWPATPLGVLRLLRWANIDVCGTQVCMIGHSDLVGLPLAELLRLAGATVQVVDKATPHPHDLCRTADVVCVATGVAGLVKPDWVKDGAVVVDIGISRVNDHGRLRLVGDVDPAVQAKASLITPVPGGVGPLTVVSLLTNVVDAAHLQAGKPRPAWG